MCSRAFMENICNHIPNIQLVYFLMEVEQQQQQQKKTVFIISVHFRSVYPTSFLISHI